MVSITQGQGFEQYSAKSRFIRSLGINANYWNEYITNMMIVTDLDKNQNARSEVNAFMDLAYFVPDNACYFNEASFDMAHDGKTNSVVMLSNLDMVQNKVNVLTVVTEGTFVLDPDVYIYQQFKSVAGGIYQNTKEVRKNVKRQLTKEDMSAIGALTTLNAINVMTRVFKIPFALPSNDPMNL